MPIYTSKPAGQDSDIAGGKILKVQLQMPVVSYQQNDHKTENVPERSTPEMHCSCGLVGLASQIIGWVEAWFFVLQFWNLLLIITQKIQVGSRPSALSQYKYSAGYMAKLSI